MRLLSLLCVIALQLPLSLVAASEPSLVVGDVQCADSCFIKGLGISGPIDETTPIQFSKLIERLKLRAKDENKPILLIGRKVRLNSPGGSIQRDCCRKAFEKGAIIRNRETGRRMQ